MKRVVGITPDTGALFCERFTDIYPKLNEHLIINGDVENSRNGGTIELLNFKTIIGDPYARCVGGYNRNINVFFLLAEAIWIWLGKKDVAFLKVFNERMADFSDDGENFHAPYGFRLRNWSTPSDNLFAPEKIYAENNFDQILEVVKMLSENPQDRRAVLSIWNPLLDLGVKSKDLPCNDMVMLKIRNGKLYTTIQNRSNDVHWGLPTNIFQFSFIGEILSEILGVGLGDQVHNSQSLHTYTNNPIGVSMLSEFKKTNELEQARLYDSDLCKYHKMDLGLTGKPLERLKQADDLFEGAFKVLCEQIKNPTEPALFSEKSGRIAFIGNLLSIYIAYTQSERKLQDKKNSLLKVLENITKFDDYPSDFGVLAAAFFTNRMSLEEIEAFDDEHKGKFNGRVKKVLRYSKGL